MVVKLNILDGAVVSGVADSREVGVAVRDVVEVVCSSDIVDLDEETATCPSSEALLDNSVLEESTVDDSDVVLLV